MQIIKAIINRISNLKKIGTQLLLNDEKINIGVFIIIENNQLRNDNSI